MSRAARWASPAAVLLPLLVSPTLQAATVITYAADPNHGTEYVNYVKERAAAFKQATGIEVQVSTVTDHRQAIAVWAAANAMPDVVDIVSDIGLTYFRMGLFQDLRPFFNKETNWKLSDFIPVALTPFTAPGDYPIQPGAVFAVPFSLWNFIAGINVDMFNKAGLTTPNDLGNGWNWATAEAYGKKLTRDLNGDGKADEYAFRWFKWIHRWSVIFRHAGGSIYNRDFDPDRVTLDTPQALEALRHMVRMVQGGYVVWDDLFAQGKAAITYDAGPPLGLWLQNAFFTVDHAPFPAGPTGANGTEFTVLGTAISRSSKNPEAAWQWLKFLWGNNESVLGFAKATSRPPALRSLVGVYSTQINTLTKHSSLILGVAQAKGTGIRPLLRDTNVHNIVQQWVHDALDGKIPPEQALTQAQAQANAVLREAFSR